MFNEIKTYMGYIKLNSGKNADEVIQILDSLIDINEEENAVQLITLEPFVGRKQQSRYHITNTTQKIKVLQAHYDITVSETINGASIEISAYCSKIAERIIHIAIGFSMFIALMTLISFMLLGFVGIIVLMALVEYLVVFLFSFHIFKMYLNKEYEKTAKIISEHIM